MNNPINQIKAIESAPPDRLSVLLRSFDIDVAVVPEAQATLIVSGDDAGRARRVILRSVPAGTVGDAPPLFCAFVEWGGGLNPLMSALPKKITLDLSVDHESEMLVSLLCDETASGRCGAGTAVNRLAEVLIIRILRSEIEAGTSRPGLFAGLADPRLSRAIVAIHEQPGRFWRNEDLADIAGLSPSHFAGRFRSRVGEPPASYLRRWRMSCAYRDIRDGGRVAAVARRYGYRSADAFGRAFQRHFGLPPTALRSGAVMG